MNKEKLQKIVETVGSEFLEEPATLTFKDGTVWDDVWAMWREMGNMFFLRSDGTIWQFTDAYPTDIKRANENSIVVDGHQSSAISVQEFQMEYVEGNS
jgi:hypothetical protein